MGGLVLLRGNEWGDTFFWRGWMGGTRSFERERVG